MPPLSAALRQPFALLALLAALIVAVVVGVSVSGVWPVGPPANPAGAASTLQIEQAEFRAEGQTATRLVSLPDNWLQRGQPVGGTGHYRLHFMLPAAVEEVWAVRAERLVRAHEVRLNGHLVHGSLQTSPQARQPIQVLIPLPPKLLQAGENTLDITVASGINGGMSALTVGPLLDLTTDYQRQQQRTVGLPQFLNMAGAGMSLFMLVLWLRRRGETVLGSFGALGLLASLRNVAYFEPGTVLPSQWASWLYMLAQLVTALLLGVFAMGFSGRRPLWFRRAMVALALLFPALSLWALWADALQLARMLLYPLLLVFIVPALGLVAQAAWQRQMATERALALSVAGVLAAGVHDYLYQLGHLSVMGSFWLPYAVPVVLAAFCVLLLNRLLLALEGAERMNVTLERRVAERTRELQAANAAKTRFLAAASHDLRQPMVSIGLLVGLMKEQVSSEPMRRVLQRLQEATGAMEALLTRLLDLSRLQAGTVRVQRQPLDLKAVFEAVAAQHAEHAQRKGLQLRVRLPARPGPAVVDSDPALLAQILGNLVGNAVRYTEQGGVLLGLRAAGPAHWRVAVWDTGPGIPAEQHETIFGEFVRGDDPAVLAASATGLGLGLAIVQRSTTLLGTAVLLRSRIGRGSCFSVLLPRASAAALAPAVSTAPLTQAVALTGRRIWLLEDDANARASLQLLLQHWGAQVQTFESLGGLRSAHALAAADAAAPDLLVSDLRLPDGRGSDALLLLRERWPQLPALIVTGNTAPEDLAALDLWREAGVPVLVKPFSSGALQAAVLAALAAPAPATA
jgi:signal transduction histidine kinase/ActR/RegA family two-component response regulator